MKHLVFIFLAGIIFSSSVFALSSKAPMPAKEAFVFSTTIIQPNEILANWRIAPDTYLYREHIQITFSPKVKADIQFPAGQFLKEVKQGKSEVYSGQLTIPVKLNTNHTSLIMRVSYQGCSKQGFCYPPITKEVTVNLANTTSVSTAPPTELTFLMTNHQGVQALLAAGNIGVTLLIFLGIGLLLAFTPCVLPMVPILTGIIVGQKGVVTTKKAFKLSLIYVLGMAITYAVGGMIAAMFGASIQVWLQKPAFIIFGSLLFALLGIELLGLYEFRFSHHWQNWVTSWSNRHQSGSFLGVFSMGVLATLILSPCVTAPLVGVLMYIGQTGDILLGTTALFVMGIGMGIPLLIVGMSSGKWLPKTGAWMEMVKMAFGFLMLAMGIWLASRILSNQLIHLLWIAWLMSIVILYRKQSRTIEIAAILATCLFVFNIWYSPVTTETHSSPFYIVKNQNELNSVLDKAKKTRQPIMLDFYADWCESCVEMDKKVFSKSDVIQQLSGFALVRVDLSANNVGDEMLLKEYNVIAPPTMLFFTVSGEEVNSRRIVGEVNATELTSKLNLFMAEGCDQKQYC